MKIELLHTKWHESKLDQTNWIEEYVLHTFNYCSLFSFDDFNTSFLYQVKCKVRQKGKEKTSQARH